MPTRLLKEMTHGVPYSEQWPRLHSHYPNKA